jgi:transposase
MRRYALRDDQGDRIKNVLPGREGHVGITAKDNRPFVDAALYRYRAGIPWRDLPERFGDPIKVHMRFSRWAKSGVSKKLFAMLASDSANSGNIAPSPRATTKPPKIFSPQFTSRLLSSGSIDDRP